MVPNTCIEIKKKGGGVNTSHMIMHILVSFEFRTVTSCSVIDVSAQEAPLVRNRKEVPVHCLQEAGPVDVRGHNCRLFSCKHILQGTCQYEDYSAKSLL